MFTSAQRARSRSLVSPRLAPTSADHKSAPTPHRSPGRSLSLSRAERIDSRDAYASSVARLRVQLHRTGPLVALKNRLSDELGEWFDQHPVASEQDRLDLGALRRLDAEELTGKPDAEFYRVMGAGLRRLEAIDQQARRVAQSLGQGGKSAAFRNEQHFRLYAQGTLLQLLDQPVASSAPVRSLGARLARLRLEVAERLAAKAAKGGGGWLPPQEVLDAAYAALEAVRPAPLRAVPSPMKVRRDRVDELMHRMVGEWGSWMGHFVSSETLTQLWKKDGKAILALPKADYEREVQAGYEMLETLEQGARQAAGRVDARVRAGRFAGYVDVLEFRLYAMGVIYSKLEGLPMQERRQALSRFRTSVRLCTGRREMLPDPRTVRAYAAQAIQTCPAPTREVAPSPAKPRLELALPAARHAHTQVVPSPAKARPEPVSAALQRSVPGLPALDVIDRHESLRSLSGSVRRLSDSERTVSEPGSAWKERVARELSFSSPSKTEPGPFSPRK